MTPEWPPRADCQPVRPTHRVSGRHVIAAAACITAAAISVVEQIGCFGDHLTTTHYCTTSVQQSHSIVVGILCATALGGLILALATGQNPKHRRRWTLSALATTGIYLAATTQISLLLIWRPEYGIS